jgi:hypothetical protein
MTEEAHKEFFAKLDALGGEEVRMRLASNVYLGGDAALVRAWIERDNERSKAEQLLLARRASTDAHKANKIASIALIIAIISIIVTAAGLTGVIRPIWPSDSSVITPR